MTHRRLTAATSDHTCPVSERCYSHCCVYALGKMGVCLPAQVPLPDVYRGQYQDPETAGELYAREVGQIIAEQDSKGGKVGLACTLP